MVTLKAWLDRMGGFSQLLLGWAVLFFLVLWRVAPPGPRGPETRTDRFSASRAMGFLSGLLSEGVPHPVGSQANERVRKRIVEDLTRLGYSPEVEEGLACDPWGTCAEVRNVVARLEGVRSGKAVLLMSHYDSVPAGPGASDDGAGTAVVLEVARALKSGPPPDNPILLLIDDGEEAGLLGASAFRETGRYAKDVGAVVNVEARGTSGPSLMFETSGDNGWLVRRLAKSLSRPITTSVFSSIYEKLPNDTDLTIFKSDKTPGLNFAFIGEVTRYHTPLDDLLHLDPGSLQHEGENALAIVRALAASDLLHPARGGSVFFDVLGLGIVSWDMRAAVPLAVTAFVLVLVAVLGFGLGGLLEWRQLLWGGAASLLSIVLGLGISGVVWGILHLVGVFPRPFVARPGPALFAFWSAGVLGAAASFAILGDKARSHGLWSGSWIVWASLGLAASRLFPGGSYLFVVPALLAGITGALSEAESKLRTLLPSFAAVLLVLPLAIHIYDAMGIPAMLGVSVAIGLLVFTGADLLSKKVVRWLLWVPLAGLSLSVLRAGFEPDATRDRPERMNVLFHQDADSGLSRWIVSAESGRIPEVVRRAAGFPTTLERPFPWSSRNMFVAPTEEARILPPEFLITRETSSETGRTIEARLVSRRGAREIRILFSPGAPVLSVRFEGAAVSLSSRARKAAEGWGVYRCLTTPPEGVSLEVIFGGNSSVPVVVEDVTPSLPPSGATLLIARPPWAVTSGEGDQTLVSRRITL